MKMVKSLVLGSAAGLLAMSAGAQAADLPVKAKAVEYVRICSLYGAGFFYIPGTDTCIKIGGYLRAEVNYNGGNSDAPFWSGDPGVRDRYTNQYNDLARMALTIDTRTQTEYGVVRTFGQADFTFATEGVTNSISEAGASLNTAGLNGTALNNTVGNGYFSAEFLFIQFAGFTFGKSASAYNTPWHGFPGNNTSYLVGGYDTVTGINNIQYTAQFGNGVSATIGLDDNSASAYNRTEIQNVVLANTIGATNVTSAGAGVLATPNVLGGSVAGYGFLSSNCTYMGCAYSGAIAPDIVGNVKVDQAWGLFQISGALHDNTPGYWANSNIPSGSQFLGQANQQSVQALGHPDSKWGGAINVALQIKNLPTGAGDDIKVEGTWGEGASKYIIGTAAQVTNGFYMYANGNPAPLPGTTAAAIGGKTAIGVVTDSIYGGFGTPLQAGVQLTQGWGFRGAFNHNWDPYWSTSLFGGVAQLSYNDTAKALWCAGYSGTTPTGGALPGGLTVGSIGAPVKAVSADYKCDPGFTLSEIGVVTRWTPVKNLTFSGEVLYAYLKTNMHGSANFAPSSAFPLVGVSTYQYGNIGTASVNFRVQRNF
jgi:Porin subfamily